MKFIDVECLLLFLNTYSLWQCSTSVENALHIFVYVYLYIYRDILYIYNFFAHCHCHGEAVYDCSEMVSSPLKDPSLHT